MRPRRSTTVLIGTNHNKNLKNIIKTTITNNLNHNIYRTPMISLTLLNKQFSRKKLNFQIIIYFKDSNINSGKITNCEIFWKHYYLILWFPILFCSQYFRIHLVLCIKYNAFFETLSNFNFQFVLNYMVLI